MAAGLFEKDWRFGQRGQMRPLIASGQVKMPGLSQRQYIAGQAGCQAHGAQQRVPGRAGCASF
jgi:hypothetical protein